MSPVQARTSHKLVNVWDAAIAAMEALAQQVKRGDLNGQLGEVQALLEALPLSSGAFCRVSNHLKNAERYLQSHERGAAAYELRMLARAVRTCLLASRPPAAPPHPALSPRAAGGEGNWTRP